MAAGDAAETDEPLDKSLDESLDESSLEEDAADCAEDGVAAGDEEHDSLLAPSASCPLLEGRTSRIVARADELLKVGDAGG